MSTVTPLRPEPPYHREVREYLDYCEWAAGEMQRDGAFLPAEHPSAAGACKMIAHNGDKGEAQKIRAAYERVTRSSDEKGGAA